VNFSKLPNIISKEHFKAMSADLLTERLNASQFFRRTVLFFDSFETKGAHTVLCGMAVYFVLTRGDLQRRE